MSRQLRGPPAKTQAPSIKRNANHRTELTFSGSRVFPRGSGNMSPFNLFKQQPRAKTKKPVSNAQGRKFMIRRKYGMMFQSQPDRQPQQPKEREYKPTWQHNKELQPQPEPSKQSIAAPSLPGSKLEEDSNVFVWGTDSSGQLGINSQPGSKTFIKAPKEFIWRVMIKQIACGREHTALVSADGQLYTMGSNINGKLGLGQSQFDLKAVYLPTLVESLVSCTVSSVACGPEHTVATNRQGEVYAWGLNTKGMLGIGKTSNYLS